MTNYQTRKGVNMTALTIDLLPDGSGALAGATLAAEYHGGMMTALYALASTGSLELRAGEGLDRIIRELTLAVIIADRDYPEDRDDLAALLAWCVAYNAD